MLGIGCLLWSACTFASGEVNNFAVFITLRILFGVFTSTCNPPALSLLRDYFPKNYRSTANSVYLFGVYLGGSLASLSVLFIKEYGWRQDYEITGLVGIVASILILGFLQEP
jgi:MFS family permease